MASNPVLNDKRFEQVIAEGYGTSPVTRTMTYGGTMSALGVMFAIICVMGWVGWSQVTFSRVIMMRGCPAGLNAHEARRARLAIGATPLTRTNTTISPMHSGNPRQTAPSTRPFIAQSSSASCNA